MRIVVASILFLAPASALAQGAHVLSAGGGVSSFTTVGALDYLGRVSDDGLGLGLSLRMGQARSAFIGGFAREDALTIEARGRLVTTVLRDGVMALRLEVSPGVRVFRGSEGPGPDAAGIDAGLRVGMLARIAMAEGTAVRAGVVVPAWFQVDPAFGVAETGSYLVLGVTQRLGAGVAAFAEVETGGVFGFDGDGPKFNLTALAGLQLTLGEAAESADTARDSAVAPFVSMEWRLMRLAGHTSHGPGFSAGVTLFEHFRVGVGGFGRPGPVNPRTFEVGLQDGESYLGQDVLSLRSDGAVIGLYTSVGFQVPGVSWLHVEVPVIVGSGAFGFYLTGENRETPDGRRVSAWENELLDGRDASGGLAIDGGVRLGLVLDSVRWLRPYAAVHYTTTVGYDAFVRSSYAGPSAALGLNLGW